MLREIGKRVIRIKIKVMTFLYCLRYNIRYNSTWSFVGKPYIIKPPFWYPKTKDDLVIGNNFSAISSFKKNSIGLIQPVLLNIAHPGSRIVIGNNVGISGATLKAMKLIRVGNNVLIGSGVLIMDNDSHPLHYQDRHKDDKETNAKEVIIEDDAFIGARAIILKGVTIGKGAVIGAGAVVYKDIPPYSVALGNPAQIVKILNH